MDKRNCRRVHFVCQVDVAISGHCFDAKTDNLSPTGMFIRTDHRIPIGKRGGISLRPGNAAPVSVNCVVVRHGYKGVAVQFKSLDYDSVTQIRALLMRIQPV